MKTRIQNQLNKVLNDKESDIPKDKVFSAQSAKNTFMIGGAMTIKDVKNVNTFNTKPDNLLFPTIRANFCFSNRLFIDYGWIEKHINYTDSLDNKHKYIIRNYSKKFDNTVNTYLRKGITGIDIDKDINRLLSSSVFPLAYYYIEDKLPSYPINENIINVQTISKELQKILSDDILYISSKYEDYIKQYVKDLRTVIENAPAISKPIMLFRGIMDDSYYNFDSVGKSNTLKGFTSTSIFVHPTKGFSEKIEYNENTFNEIVINGIVYEFLLMPQTINNALFIANLSLYRSEFEVLLINNLNMTYIETNNKYIVDDLDIYNMSNNLNTKYLSDLPTLQNSASLKVTRNFTIP